jgi:hypothetical protein
MEYPAPIVGNLGHRRRRSSPAGCRAVTRCRGSGKSIRAGRAMQPLRHRPTRAPSEYPKPVLDCVLD